MNILRFYLIFVMLITFALCLSCTTPKHNFTVDDASNLLNEYSAALATGDSAKVKPFWSEQSLSRDGFWLMHAWRGGFLRLPDWRDFLNDFDFEIREVRPEKNYHVIELNWLPRDTTKNAGQAQPREMRYYVIREGEQWKLINPIDVLTSDWQSHETDYFVYHFPKETDIQDHLAELKLMDKECEKALKTFEIDLPHKIHFYKARTPSECGDLLMHPSSNGYAAVGFVSRQKDTPDAPGFRIVVSTSFINPHEVVHLLTALAGIPFVNAAIVEGIASALGGNTQTTADFTLAEAKNLLDHPMHFPLQKLLTLSDADFLRNNFITYYEAGAFIKFLIDTFGIQKLKELCIETQSAEGFVQTIPNVYGYSIDELEAQLQSYLAQRNTPDVAFTIPPEAELVFSMSDPAGDDTGDGDYTYPRHKSFKKGVFDLQKFEVLKDSSRAYFRLLFQNMIQPVSYGASTEKFAPGVVIAIKKAGSDGRHVQRFCHGVQFEEGEGYDVKLNIGLAVSASNNFGKVYFSTPDVYKKMANRESNTIDFSLPVDFLGEPENDWQYFVGVGLVSDRTMNFLNAGLFPVYKKHPVFISGGNFDYGNPAFIDILLPENADQAKILSDYDAEKGRRATVPMLGMDDWVFDAKNRGADVFAVKELQEDFRQLRKGIENNHPALYAFTGEAMFDLLFDVQYNLIDRPMSTIEFYRIVAPLVASIGCGHSKISAPESWWRRQPDRFFPLRLRFQGNSAFVLQNHSEEGEIALGSELISINGQTVSDIVRQLMSVIPADGYNQAAKIDRLNRRFPYLYALHFGFPATFRLTCRPAADAPAQSVALSPVTGAALAAARPWRPELSFDILEEKNTAIMSIDHFAFYDNNKKFFGFIDNAFEQIHASNIENLVLDLRGNDGGDPFCTSHLLSYLAKKPAPYFGNFHLQYFKLTRPVPLAEKRFQGNLFILIDGKCFSSTAHLCALLKYHNIGTFIGSETGGTFTCNDAVTEVELDNTKLILQIARRSFAVAVKGMPRDRGILPDYPIEPKIEVLLDGRDPVKEFAFGLVEKWNFHKNRP